MKRFIAVAAALVVSSISVFALDITAGARGNFNIGAGTSLEGKMKTSIDHMKDTLPSFINTKEGGNMGGGFAVYANIGLLELGGGSLGVQPEVGMNFNNGWNMRAWYEDSVDEEMIVEDTTVDIPVLVTFTYPIFDSFYIGGGVGPYLSIPFGVDQIAKDNISGDTNKQSTDYDIKASMNFGLAFDVNAGYKVSPGSIVLDVRYMMDLTPTKITSKRKSTGTTSFDNEEMVTRRLLTLGVGYQIKF